MPDIQQLWEPLNNEMMRGYQEVIMRTMEYNLRYGTQNPLIVTPRFPANSIPVPEDAVLDEATLTTTTIEVPQVNMEQLRAVREAMAREIEARMWQQAYEMFNQPPHISPDWEFWAEPANPGETPPSGCVDLMSMSEEEIDAFWDNEERQIDAAERSGKYDNQAHKAWQNTVRAHGLNGSSLVSTRPDEASGAGDQLDGTDGERGWHAVYGSGRLPSVSGAEADSGRSNFGRYGCELRSGFAAWSQRVDRDHSVGRDGA